MPEMSMQMWAVARMLAADLSLNRVSKNLVQQTSEYLLQVPGASLSDYLERLERLGDAFAGGKSGKLERTDLHRVLSRLSRAKEWPSDVAGVRLVLGWAARLLQFYADHPRQAAKKSSIPFVKLRKGRHIEGIVRERSRDMLWVQIGLGQLGKGRRLSNADIGDKVLVQIQQVKSEIDFDVNILKIVCHADLPVTVAADPAPPDDDIPEPPETDEEVSQAAKDFMEFFKRHYEEEKDDDG